MRRGPRASGLDEGVEALEREATEEEKVRWEGWDGGMGGVEESGTRLRMDANGCESNKNPFESVG